MILKLFGGSECSTFWLLQDFKFWHLRVYLSPLHFYFQCMGHLKILVLSIYGRHGPMVKDVF